MHEQFEFYLIFYLNLVELFIFEQALSRTNDLKSVSLAGYGRSSLSFGLQRRSLRLRVSCAVCVSVWIVLIVCLDLYTLYSSWTIIWYFVVSVKSFSLQVQGLVYLHNSIRALYLQQSKARFWSETWTFFCGQGPVGMYIFMTDSEKAGLLFEKRNKLTVIVLLWVVAMLIVCHWAGQTRNSGEGV